jgi:hypothetical protein
MYALQDGEYVEVQVSLVLPQLPIRELPQLIESYRSLGRRALRKAAREWALKWK